jgi:flagellin
MGLRVNTNIASLTAQRNLSLVTARLQGNYSRLSSGLRIATAADDAAGLAISEKMRSQIRSYAVAGRNAQDGISLVQTAEGALNEVSNILSRMRELSVQAANGTMSATDRQTTDVEFQSLMDEIQRVAMSTEFNAIELLQGGTADIQVGIGTAAYDRVTVNLVNTTTGAGGLNIDTMNVLDVAASQASITAVDAAIDLVNTARGELGASQNRLQSVFSSIMNVRENLSAAESRIRDVDVAWETADLTRNTILQQAAVSVLAQANVQPQLALSLLQS